MKTYVALLSCLLLPALAVLSACSSAGKCKRGEMGCACKLMSQACDTGAVCVEGLCRERAGGTGGSDGMGSSGTGGSKSDAGAKKDGGPGSDAGRRNDGGVKPDAGPPTPIACPNDSLDSACKAFCQAFCQNQELLCVTSQCAKGECDPGGELYKVCNQTCGTDASPIKCIQSLCVGEGQRTCEEFGYADSTSGVYQSGCFNDDPQCVINPDFGCSDTCGSLSNNTGGDLAQNGVCEDGGKNATASTCPRGTDCTDCKPRTCAKTAAVCDNNGDCCGYYAHKSLCVDTGSGGSCLATCTDTMTCPSGQMCRAVSDNKNSVCAPR